MCRINHLGVMSAATVIGNTSMPFHFSESEHDLSNGSFRKFTRHEMNRLTHDLRRPIAVTFNLLSSMTQFRDNSFL
jgi:hypothetical protein